MFKNKYDTLSNLFKKAYPGKSVIERQELLNKDWYKAKKDPEAYEALLRKVKTKIAKNAKRSRDL